MKMQPRNSIADQAYNLIMERIQSGEIASGERLIETQVANYLQTSRTPLREAFRRLEQDGIVERVPQGGVQVTPVTLATVREIFGIRVRLEPYAVELACDAITDEDIHQLKTARNQAMDLIDTESLSREQKIWRLFDLNTQFHDVIYHATGSRHLYKLINNLRYMVLRMRAVGLREESAWRKSWDEHTQLIHHLERRDKEAASKLMTRHIEAAASHAASHVKQEE